MTFQLLALSTATLVWLSGCSRDDAPLGPVVDAGSQAVVGPAGADPVDEFPSVERVAAQIRALGSFRPGTRIHLIAGGRANRPAEKTTIEVLSLDEDLSDPVASNPGRSRSLGRKGTSLGRGAEDRFTTSVTFAQPGYYRLLVQAVASSTTPPVPGDSIVLDQSHRTLWVLIDEKGGRITDGYDAAALAGRQPKFGSYGPFTQLEVPPRASSRAPSALLADYAYNGRITYLNRPLQRRDPVPDMEIQMGCGYQGQFGTVFENQTLRTDANGNWSGVCPSTRPYLHMSAALFNIYSHSRGKDGAFSGVGVNGQLGGSFPDLRVINDDAAHTFILLSRRVPQAFTKFGRSRGRVEVYVANADINYHVDYSSSPDRIRTNQNHTFGPEGEFATNHEYGHAFQWKAIEAPQQNDCPSSHKVDGAYTLSCAFVEGFADFFGVWIGGDALTAKVDRSDYYIETNRYRALGNGSIIEGAVAAFFYDLVDGSAEPDNATNTGKFAESWDNVVYPASYLAQVMQTCVLVAPIPIGKLDGVDQFVYCAERSMAAQALTQYFATRSQNYSGFTESATEPLSWSSADIRRLWLYNLYNVGP